MHLFSPGKCNHVVRGWQSPRNAGGAYSDEPDNSRWTFRVAKHNMRSEAREIRTPNLLIWSQTRCHCAIAPLVRDTKFQEHSFKNAK